MWKNLSLKLKEAKRTTLYSQDGKERKLLLSSWNSSNWSAIEQESDLPKYIAYLKTWLEQWY